MALPSVVKKNGKNQKLWTDVCPSRISPILMIFGQNWSPWPDLSFETHFDFFIARLFDCPLIRLTSLFDWPLIRLTAYSIDRLFDFKGDPLFSKIHTIFDWPLIRLTACSIDRLFDWPLLVSFVSFRFVSFRLAWCRHHREELLGAEA